MRFQGLPPELHVGSADLLLLTRSAIIEASICSSCGSAGPSVLVCPSNHVTCRTCAIQRDAPAAAAWCPGCNRLVAVSVCEVPVSVFAQLKLRCNCGFEGTLATISEHLLTEGAHDALTLSSGARPASAGHEQDLDERIRNIVLEEIVRSRQERSAAGTGLDSLDGGSPDEVRDLLEDTVNTKVNELRRELVEMVEELVEPNRNIVTAIASAPLGVFWFDFDELYDGFSSAQGHSATYSAFQHKVVAGICFRVYVRIQLVDDNDEYVGVYAAPSDTIRTPAPWPLRRKVTLSLHDENGEIVVSQYANSYQNGAYASGYENPESTRSSGFDRFVKVATLRAQRCLVNGKMCISVKVEPLEITD